MIQRRQALITLASALALPTTALATPTRYVLDPTQSTVDFGFRLSGKTHSGSMPIQQAKIILDPDQLATSRVAVTLNVARARTGLLFVTQVMTGPQVLDAAKFPTIHFVSRRIELGATGRISEGAHIFGDLTLHGVTRPITLKAALYRPRGTPANDLSQLDVILSGALSRAAFGASGYADLVADIVTLDIRARLHLAK